jgi:phosphoribosyl 1,2-cyclic phosphodiesterase
MLKITFYGVRGSTPCSSSAYFQYGGHTSCVVAEAGDCVVVFDAGSGIYDANDVALNNPSKEVFLFFSHVHLDHIMGLPFFAPMWKKDYKVNIFAGSLTPYGGIQSFLRKTFTEPLFPVSFSNFPAQIKCQDFKSGTLLKISDALTLNTCQLNHPNGAIGYRLNYKNSSICYVTDTEHLLGHRDDNILELIKDSDLLIYDSSYGDNSFSQHKGWGHSTWQEGVRLAQEANVKKLAIFHHDPSNTDDKMTEIEKKATELWSGAFVAKQGQSIQF